MVAIPNLIKKRISDRVAYLLRNLFIENVKNILNGNFLKAK